MEMRGEIKRQMIVGTLDKSCEVQVMIVNRLKVDICTRPRVLKESCRKRKTPACHTTRSLGIGWLGRFRAPLRHWFGPTWSLQVDLKIYINVIVWSKLPQEYILYSSFILHPHAICNMHFPHGLAWRQDEPLIRREAKRSCFASAEMEACSGPGLFFSFTLPTFIFLGAFVASSFFFSALSSKVKNSLDKPRFELCSVCFEGVEGEASCLNPPPLCWPSFLVVKITRAATLLQQSSCLELLRT